VTKRDGETKKRAGRETAQRVLRIEADAIASLIPRLNETFDRAVTLVAGCSGRVVTTGMGKSGIICRKIAATLASTGTPAVFLHPAEALHGDLGMLVSGDLVIALSNSGETEELVKLLPTVRRLGTPLIALLGNRDSTIGRYSDLVLEVGVYEEACVFGLAPTASTTAALALGDALAMAVCEEKGFRTEDFARLHPGGGLGKRLLRVADLMHAGNQVPKVTEGARMEDVIYEMSSKGLGITTIVDDSGRLLGVISDGDLRRLLQQERGDLLKRTAGECMTRHPVTIDAEELATKALHLMETRKITSLVVADSEKRVSGIIHLHDLWGTEMF
jgi:arabinose-5-phosphate isomerase